MSELKTEELTEILKQTTDIDVFLDDNELLPNGVGSTRMYL